ncbi:hypothetical protein TraAM80_00993 [Trypanosoma rangeli]|uniref:Uncharacterized protein n=1 Tax=Trypanosoma rangeli TaxID=5698 RepID=A0A422P0X4_TRYRA|nr:uncharacterized protein TraAM80_00993 [Trypanosoma rangeli]RNF11376.1 hypothetical protein TraAM80_00993 [Trypanosoma rangeli]|eukprot:RNF11376.1 hypothetical protein TraAM80_00993 [Trypanosoma rangeli]
MPLNNSNAATISNGSDIEYVEREIAPMYVSLSRTAPLPPGDYVRVIALCGSGYFSRDESPLLKTISAEGSWNSGGRRQNSTEPLETEPERFDFALHVRGARHCRLLDTILDGYDLQMSAVGHDAATDVKENKVNGREKAALADLPSVVLPQATSKGCKMLFRYLDMITTRVPTTISKPLRAPLDELIQPWEMNFLLHDCMDDTTSRAIAQQFGDAKGVGAKGNKAAGDTVMAYHSAIVNNAPGSLNLLLELAMISDFLIVEPLRQLTCAFLASLALGASSEAELLRLCGVSRPMKEEELEPLYAQFPFLHIDPTDGL